MLPRFMLSVSDIQQARARIGDAVKVTPCPHSPVISEARGAYVSLKLENLQHTGAFKSRGALNRLLTLTGAQRHAGVVAASAGNHAQGVAHHATRLGIASTIVMPVGTPLVKVSATTGFGGKVVLEGENYDAAYEHARSLAETSGAFLVHPYDDDAVMAGQGTIGLEILEQNPDVEVIIVPVGGGGLIAGVACAVKALKPKVRVVGVEVDVAPSMQVSVAQGTLVTLPAARTLADGIAVRRCGQRCFDLCRDLVDDWATVGDADIARGILYLLEREKTLAEGAGAAAVAALLARRVSDIEGKNITALVTGGNIDVNLLARIIERGLVETGRLMRFEIRVRDTPGVLAEMLHIVAEARANVVAVQHERVFSGGDVAEVAVELVVETRGHDSVTALESTLRSHGFSVRRL